MYFFILHFYKEIPRSSYIIRKTTVRTKYTNAYINIIIRKYPPTREATLINLAHLMALEKREYKKMLESSSQEMHRKRLPQQDGYLTEV